jgi:hypothetical protein
MKDAVTQLMKEHGGKTMTISFSTVFALLWIGAQYGVVPMPASRAYVDTVVGEKTKGLDYLVRKELEHDLDVLNYSTNCMRNFGQVGALRRLEQQYEEWFEQSYVHRPCEQLERDPQIAAEVPVQ